MSSTSSYHFSSDEEDSSFYHPIISYVQGSLACERRESTGRYGKDRKEFRKVQALNKRWNLSLYEVLRTKTQEDFNEESPGPTVLEERLSHLGARYPSIPGLGIYVSNLKVLEGRGQFKKIFDLLFWISEQAELSSYWKYLLLSPIGKLLLNLNGEGKWKENSSTIFLFLGMNSLANEFGRDILENKSAISDSLNKGKKLAMSISIKFYSNSRPYEPKIRRRGYARNSPVRPDSSKTAVSEANSSLEYLLEAGYAESSTEGGYTFMKKTDLEEIIFKTFQNSLEAFELWQQEELKRKKIKEKKAERDSPTVKDDKEE